MPDSQGRGYQPALSSHVTAAMHSHADVLRTRSDGSQAAGGALRSPAHRPPPIITHAHDQLPAGCRNSLLWCEILMESHAAAMLQAQPTSSATGHYSFLNRAAGAGIIRTDRESLAELERKLMEARQQFQDLKEEKCNLASSKGCGCGCCPHAYVQDQKATSVGPDSRSVSETSNLPVKRSGRQRSVKSLSSQDTMTMGAAHDPHGSPNSEGLLLAVDKFLSMK